jgi:hypothetical protein
MMFHKLEPTPTREERYVARRLKPFHVLVGPNASGKTTFLDVIGFLGDIVSNGLDGALADRAPDPRDLLFRSRGSRLVMGWSGRSPSLRRWLVREGWLHQDTLKPARPKAAFHSALRAAGVARSASLYQQIAETVSLQRCDDRSFGRLRSTLQEWFPVVS